MLKGKSSSWRSYGLVAAACLILAFQAAASRRLTIVEEETALPQLHSLPSQLGDWKESGETVMDAGTLAYLKPDEYILRDYTNPRGRAINLFVAYFRSLQSKYGPHSPRICLPGAGWLVSSSKIINVEVPGRTGGIPVNQFTMEKGSQRILVLYWYQNDRGIWAEDFYGKLRLLPDLIRYRRSDVSLVRLIMPLETALPVAELTNSIQFTKEIFPRLVDDFHSVH